MEEACPNHFLVGDLLNVQSLFLFLLLDKVALMKSVERC